MNYVVAAIAGLAGSVVAKELSLPFWPALAVLLIGYTGGRVAGYFVKD